MYKEYHPLQKKKGIVIIVRCQEEEPIDWEDVPFLPEVSAPFIPFRPPRKIRFLISAQVSEPSSLSANSFPNVRTLIKKRIHDLSSQDYSTDEKKCLVTLPRLPSEIVEEGSFEGPMKSTSQWCSSGNAVRRTTDSG
ncbi:hypothetical protein TNIN_336761 [Trichonephila inaurata madagascariensis]|uniref:Uncharacterized protein n=1 Tax=Trichonephila inaurata madagascariensis TaxID=2747483 RepID=A0A8X6XPD0_9ARAC|nr:hypothetical protein TNIN_336761 [Trichonephila inaurata madagascariensis]